MADVHWHQYKQHKVEKPVVVIVNAARQSLHMFVSATENPYSETH